jgi:hypothetical protein
LKDIPNSKYWLSLAAEELNYSEFKVFTMWFMDAPDYHAGATRIHTFLHKMRKDNIRRAMRGIEKKGFIMYSGKYYPTAQGSHIPIMILNVEKLQKSKNPSVQTHFPSPQTHFPSPGSDFPSPQTHVLDVLDSTKSLLDLTSALNRDNFKEEYPKKEGNL